jgi:hypothetical protein
MVEENMQQDVVRPVSFKWIILKSKRYGELRKRLHFAGFADIEWVDDDALNVKKGFLGLGARMKDIHVYEDCDFNNLKELFEDIS